MTVNQPGWYITNVNSNTYTLGAHLNDSSGLADSGGLFKDISQEAIYFTHQIIEKPKGRSHHEVVAHVHISREKLNEIVIFLQNFFGSKFQSLEQWFTYKTCLLYTSPSPRDS